jgi:hypothetical protein
LRARLVTNLSPVSPFRCTVHVRVDPKAYQLTCCVTCTEFSYGTISRAAEVGV